MLTPCKSAERNSSAQVDTPQQTEVAETLTRKGFQTFRGIGRKSERRTPKPQMFTLAGSDFAIPCYPQRPGPGCLSSLRAGADGAYPSGPCGLDSSTPASTRFPEKGWCHPRRKQVTTRDGCRLGRSTCHLPGGAFPALSRLRLSIGTTTHAAFVAIGAKTSSGS